VTTRRSARSWSAIRGGTGAFRPWLGAIARNTLRDRLRRGPRDAPRPLVEDPLADLDVWEREHRAEEVRAAVDALPHRYRAALTLRYFAGLGYRDAAADLGLTPKGFETRLARARLRLRRALVKRTDGLDGLY
jgi:RNA polymerase sigma-70 factor (ECF subfamily)